MLNCSMRSGCEVDEERCVTCRWCDPLPYEGEKGECRYHAPQVQSVLTPKGPGAITLWPTVNLLQHWCGHWKALLVEQEEQVG